MSELILLKLGGSIITDKTQPFTIRHDALKRLAVEISTAVTERGRDLQLIIGHGAGSFGHVVAAQYQTHKGAINANSWQGFAAVATAVANLSHTVVNTLREVGVPAMRFQPSASMRTRGNQLMYFETHPLKEAVRNGLVPVVHGDVSVDANQGMSIVSTETLFDNLARELTPSKIALCGQLEGVFEADPHHNPDADLIEEIDNSNWPEVEAMLGGSHGTDVTGGMFTKVRDMYRLTVAMPPMQAFIFSGEEPGNVETLLKGQTVDFGTIIN